MAEPSGRRAGCARGASPVPREQQRSWAQLLSSQPSPGQRSRSSSICTEDFAARFWEGMVEPLLCQEEPAGAVPAEGAGPGRDEPLFPTERSPDVRPQLAMEPGRHSWRDAPSSLRRRESLESLGARITRVSRSRVGMAWGGPWPVPSVRPVPSVQPVASVRPVLGRGDAPHGDLLATASPWRAPGICAGTGTGTGSPGSGVPRLSSATTRAHPTSRALGLRRQEPAALRGRGGSVTLAVDAVDREGAGSRKSAGTAAGTPELWGSPVSPGLYGDQKVGLPCKGVAASLCTSQEGTRELGSRAKPRSQGHRDRAGLALLGHTWDTHQRCHTELHRMSQQAQGASVGWDRLDKEKRRTATSQGEKLELLERLRELERDCRSLLQQRLRVLRRLHELLQRDKAETLRQLREALEQERLRGLWGHSWHCQRCSDPSVPALLLQDRAGRSGRAEHLPSRPREPAGPGRAGGSPAVGTLPVAPWGHGPRPGSAAGPSPAAFGHALRVLRGLRQQLQRRLGQWQSVQGALGAHGEAAHGKEEGEPRQQPEKAPGAPRGRPIQREHPHTASSIPAGSPGLLPHLQHHFQELQLERTQHTELACPEGTIGHQGQRGGAGPAQGGASPSATAPVLIQGKEEVQSSSEEHNSCWE